MYVWGLKYPSGMCISPPKKSHEEFLSLLRKLGLRGLFA